jgi:hypothetical protein
VRGQLHEESLGSVRHASSGSSSGAGTRTSHRKHTNRELCAESNTPRRRQQQRAAAAMIGNRYKKIEKGGSAGIGCGTYGEVFKCEDTQSGEIVACKVREREKWGHACRLGRGRCGDGLLVCVLPVHLAAWPRWLRPHRALSL